MGKAERTREYILEKTAPVFNRKGFSGTSLADLTEATGLTKGAIYGNFENKDDVALAAFDHNIAKVLKQVRRLQNTETTAVGKLKAYLTVYGQGSVNGLFDSGCPIINTGTEADDTHPLLKNKAAGVLAKWHKGISTIILQGIETGEIKADTNTSKFAALMIALIEGGITVSKISGDTGYMRQSMGHLALLIDQLKS